MSLNKEWNSRILLWKDELKNHFYRELGTIDFEGFTTKLQLSLSEALQGRFTPMPPGTDWGAKWEYGWFRGKLTLPEAAAGERVVLRPDLGGESTIFVNGANAGAKDLQHRELTLCMEGTPGQIYEIVAESYAGHGPRLECIPPLPPERTAVPEPGPTQVTVGRSTFGIWEEEAYQLWMDVDTLYQLRCNLNENSLRVAQIDKGLKDFTLIVDLELPYKERVASFKAGRKRLAPLLACVNGSTAPLMYICGQSHLDLAWLWPWAETERKCARTLSNQLALMDEYPGYRFFFTQPPCFLVLKELYPELYERVLSKVQSGQLIPEGGMWVESDTNLPGGESLIRQLIYGKRFFKEEFGIESELVWLPDTFGFSAALPQIFKGCGIKYFGTKKIFDNYNGGDPFPYNLMMWEGIDGTQILTHIIRKSNSPIDPEMLIRRWEIDRVQKDDLSTFLFTFGYGDGGGGPVRDHLEYARRMKDLEGLPRTRMSHPIDFFKQIEENGLVENRYVGELYFQAHRGTYTSQARTKRGNRKSEFALRETEMWGSVAYILKEYDYPYERMEKVWKKLLFNQFHDILPGSSIQRVHQEAEADFQDILRETETMRKDAFASLADEQVAGYTVFNSLGWERRELVAFPAGARALSAPDGVNLPIQKQGETVLAEITVPSCGWTSVRVSEANAEMPRMTNTFHVSEKMLENDLLRLDFNERGEITGIYDKEAQIQLAVAPCNCFHMYKDATTYYDAWDIDSMYEKLPVRLDAPATIRVECAGPLVATLWVERKLHDSFMTQRISLRKGSRRVDFQTTVDWREHHKLLKVAFPVNIQTDEGIQEIQFGHIRRPNHKSRPYDADRYEVCQHKWTAITEENRGFAVLNDCKYGVNVVDGSINLTLLKAALVPDMYADRGIQEFTYAFYVWNGPFVESNLVREAYELNCPVGVTRGVAKERSVLQVDRSQIVIETVKPAEDRSGDLIVRMYESKKTTVRCNLETSLPVKRAEQTDMLERAETSLNVENGKIEMQFRPFEIKTVRLKMR